MANNFLALNVTLVGAAGTTKFSVGMTNSLHRARDATYLPADAAARKVLGDAIVAAGGPSDAQRAQMGATVCSLLDETADLDWKMTEVSYDIEGDTLTVKN